MPEAISCSMSLYCKIVNNSASCFNLKSFSFIIIHLATELPPPKGTQTSLFYMQTTVKRLEQLE